MNRFLDLLVYWCLDALCCLLVFAALDLTILDTSAAAHGALTGFVILALIDLMRAVTR